MEAQVVAALVGGVAGAGGSVFIQWWFIQKRHSSDRRADVLHEALKELYAPVDQNLTALVLLPDHPNKEDILAAISATVANYGFLFPRELEVELLRYTVDPATTDVKRLSALFRRNYEHVRKEYLSSKFVGLSDLEARATPS